VNSINDRYILIPQSTHQQILKQKTSGVWGLNHIKKGMSIYKVSKLLGHKSVRTAE
jgi:hypothetical protein